MSLRLITIFLILVTLAVPRIGRAAAPSVTLTTRLVKNGQNLSVTISPVTSAAGCAYSLYGSAKLTDFENDALGGRLLANFPGASELTKRSAKRVGSVRRPQQKAYFRAQLTCGADTSLSNVSTLALKSRASSALSVSRWLRQAGTLLNSVDVALSAAFPNLSFSNPLALVSPGDGTARLFAVEQGGKIFVFQNRSSARTKTLFLDLSSRVSKGGELGLLGLAFHPHYSQNGKFYVNYTEPRSPGSNFSRSVIAGFTVSAGNANVADSSSEQRYIVLNQPFDNHNGGDLSFGPDGFLYIGFGDGGSGGDPDGNAQNRSSLLGKMLRIDVDTQEGQLAYAIPSTNPYKGNQSGYREEIFAYGLRNPFRFSFDFPSGRLWVGDVGQSEIEEIDLISSGANLGWNTMEGSQCYPSNQTCDTSGLTLPITEYNHAIGQSIIGGYVYNGRSVGHLKGLYVFGDFSSGVIFSLLYDGLHAIRRTLLNSGLSISAFGRDENGELYVVSYGEGKIYKIDAR